MTGGPRRQVRRRLTVVLATVGVLVGLGVLGFMVLRPAPHDPAATDDPSPITTVSRSATTAPVLPSSVTSLRIDPTQGRAAYPVVKVVDGDTVHVLVDGVDETVRIVGINTPETDECWGSEATQAATRLLDGTSVVLIADPTQADRDRYGRLLRYVVLPDGTDFGLRMISDGNADEYTFDNAYAHQQAYRDADAAAAAGGRGLWNVATCDGRPAGSGEPSPPATHSTPAAPATAETGPNGCTVKGNVSSNGKIYHVPGSRDYARTSIDESRGERWFCSVAEAEAAGWRAPGN